MIEDQGQQFYSVPEAARLLDVSAATLWRWITARRLRAYRVGPRRIRVRRDDLEALVQPTLGREAAPPKSEEPQDIFANYEPERAREALRKSAGVLAGVDRDALLADIHATRKKADRNRLG